MRAQTVEIQAGMGRILSSPIFRPGGKKLLAKGHLLREEDIRILQSEGLNSVWVAELEEGEIVSCPECGTDFEVVTVSPLELNPVEEYDEDEDEEASDEEDEDSDY